MLTSSPARASGPRRLLTAVAATAMALTLAACGSSSASTSSGGTATARTVATAHGKRWKATPKVTTGADIDYEEIAKLRPDLIVGVDVPYLSKAYEKLSAIAPTTFAPLKDTATWSAYPDAAARYDDRIVAVRKTYGTELADARWDVIQGGFDNGNYWFYGADSPVGAILSESAYGSRRRPPPSPRATPSPCPTSGRTCSRTPTAASTTRTTTVPPPTTSRSCSPFRHSRTSR
ncbi:ABC transporter substrate-binding protein [Streptomyces sp. NBC_00343]|uniref:ABC transporter substrate-binding protein n=1 Tax=Streptomyces sp. NBC_00343 TaxID=2975719 RepID=UPI002E2CF4B6|nr:ABC transporter substrate-binding protein [Streptomyces sp. NBC_00343]